METAQLTWLQDKNSGYVDSLGNPSDQLLEIVPNLYYQIICMQGLGGGF